MSLPELCIRRPVGTTLVALGLLLLGAVAYHFLPISSMPNVELPTIRVTASRPGADPTTMAATIAAPLERRLGQIPGVTELTSSSSLGTTAITVQFDLSRSIDAAGRDVQAALNAAATDLPGDLPTLPSFRKVNPNAFPVMTLALTSRTLSPEALYDAADSVFVQRLSQVAGVAEVRLNGTEQPAIRIRLDPTRLAAMGTSLEDVRNAVSAANPLGPTGAIDGPDQALSVGVNEQLRRPVHFRNLVVKSRNGNTIKLGDIATVEQGVRNTRSAGWYNGEPAVLVSITKQADANVIETVDAVKALLPELGRWVPAGINVSVLSDRTATIRASVDDMQGTLLITIALVMMVVFVFLRRLTPTVAAGVTVPLSLAGTFAAMWVAGFTLDNLSLMALAISVGFVVDDAIVMIENIDRTAAEGRDPIAAAIEGARQIGFTVVAISLSLLAAFIPLFLMGGLVGRFFREFSLTLSFAIVVSTFVSLTITPMICARWRRTEPAEPSWLDRAFEAVMGALVRVYARSLAVILRWPAATMLGFLATIGATVWLYGATPKGFLPQDDTGLVMAFSEAATDVSFPAMMELQKSVAAVIQRDPAVAGVGSSLGGGGWGGSVNTGFMTINLKPAAERAKTTEVIARLRRSLAQVPGIQVFIFAAQDIRVGGRQARSEYEFTLWSADPAELTQAAAQVLATLRKTPELVDVSSNSPPNGLQATITIDRAKAALLGVRIQDINAALNNAYAQRQISTLYTQRNQYRVVLEVEEPFRRDPTDLSLLHVPGPGGVQVPLTAVASVERALAPLTINHQGVYPSITITYGLAPGVTLDEGNRVIRNAIGALHLPDAIRADFSGDAKAFVGAAGNQGVLILAALVAVYLVLGVLYESLIHPLTILSTLPSAGLGALLALNASNTPLSLIAFIGIIMLIGIVKKNGIMLVDFALDAQRRRGLAPREAVHEACLERFRPILMTTLAALLGALPLLLATGPGSEIRRPLGVTIVGGLALSQVLTLYTTPVVYLLLDRLATWTKRLVRRRPAAEATPAAAE